MPDGFTGSVHSSVDAGAHALAGLILWLWHSGTIGQGIVVFVALMIVVGLLVLATIAENTGNPTAAKGNDPREEALYPKLGRPGLIERITIKPQEPAHVGDVNLDAKERHIGLLGITGSYKTTTAAWLIRAFAQLGKPTISLLFDESIPAEQALDEIGGVGWSRQSGLGWYPWAGELESAVQRVEFVFERTLGDVGVHRAKLHMLTRRVWGQQDARNRPRRIGQIRQALANPPRDIQIPQNLRENWEARLGDLEEALGDSIGVDIDIAILLKRGISWGWRFNAFQDLSSRELWGNVALMDAKRALDEVRHAVLQMDELSLMDPKLLKDVAQTLRTRGTTLVAGSQNHEDFPKSMANNVGIWFLGVLSGSAATSRKFASDCTFGLIPPTNFGEHVLRPGQFWVYHRGRVLLAQMPIWSKPRYRRHVDIPILEWDPELEDDPDPIVPAPGTTQTGSEQLTVPVEPPSEEAAQNKSTDPPDWWLKKLRPHWLVQNEWGDKLWANRVWNPEAPDCDLSGYALNSSGRPKFRCWNRWATTYEDGAEILEPRVTDGVIVYRYSYDEAPPEHQFDHKGRLEDGMTVDHACHLAGARVPVVDGVPRPDVRCFTAPHLRQLLAGPQARERQARHFAAKRAQRATQAAD